MSDSTTSKFSAPDFVPDKYVKELARNCVGGEELQQQKLKIQSLCKETANALKKNVFENHMQFIETAEEISHLEAEMYKLSHLLSEQRTILNSLSNSFILGNENTVLQAVNDKNDSEADKLEEQRKSKLISITEKVEGCMNLLDAPERTFIHEGDFLELDPEENTAMQRMHGYLFSDCLMLTSWIANRRGPMRYRFQTFYPIKDMAVVNVRDLGNAKQAFKLLAFPDTRVFQCNNFTSKKDWLEKFELAKKNFLDKEEQKNIKKKESTESSMMNKVLSLDSPTNQEELASPEAAALPDWLLDVAEELDVLIVERHFDEAYQLMVSARQNLQTPPLANHLMKGEIINKIDFKQKHLIDILMKELEVTPEWSPRGGLRSLRNSIRILNKFQMNSQACELFLAICSHTVKVHVKSVQLEGSTTTYVKQVGEVFFCTLSDVLSEFLASFPKCKLSAVVVWASDELRSLMNQIVKQIFTPQSSLQSIAECTEALRGQCKLFCEFGLDLCFQLDSSLRTPIVKALRDYKDKIAESMKSKLLEDTWTPVNMHTKVGVNKFLQSMQSLGLVLAKYVINETWVDLSSSTIWFTQSVLTVQNEGLRMVTGDMMDTLDECIFAIFNGRLMQSIGNDSSYAQKNFKFILDILLPLMLRKYREEVGYDNEKLVGLATKFGVAVPGPKKQVVSNVTKYTSNEYL